MHRSNNAFQLLLLVSLAGLAGPPAQTARAAVLVPVVYIAPDGDDARDCATPATRCATLQHSLDQLADGGEARLAAGRYTGTAALNRSATIAGGYALPNFTPGAGSTVLDAQQASTTLRISGAVRARLTRLTITGGLADPTGTSAGRGGGISIRGATVLLDHVEVSGNIADVNGSGRGGGVYVRDGSLALTYSVVTSNTATLLAGRSPIGAARAGILPADTAMPTGSGGGIYALNAHISMRQSTIISNSTIISTTTTPIETRGWGGGIYADSCTLETQDVLFLANGALASDGSGGAIRLLNSQVQLRGGEISDNRAGPAGQSNSSGGGVDIRGGAATLTNIALRRNSAANGSGIALSPADVVTASTALTLTNVLLAGHQGAALALLENAGGRAHAHVRHSTLIANGVGVLAEPSQSAVITNSLLVGNGTAVQALVGGTISLAHTDRYDNRLNAAGDVRIGPAGDLALPPKFAAGDAQLRLAPDSPLLDRGTPLPDIATDFEGQPRNADGNGDGIALPDIGWDELARSAAMFGPDQTLFAQPGQVLVSGLDLRNVGLAGDTFNISITAPGGWGATVSPSRVTLAPRTQIRLTVRISVPAGAPPNSQTVLTVQAIGQTSTAAARIGVVVAAP